MCYRILTWNFSSNEKNRHSVQIAWSNYHQPGKVENLKDAEEKIRIKLELENNDNDSNEMGSERVKKVVKS